MDCAYLENIYLTKLYTILYTKRHDLQWAQPKDKWEERTRKYMDQEMIKFMYILKKI